MFYLLELLLRVYKESWLEVIGNFNLILLFSPNGVTNERLPDSNSLFGDDFPNEYSEF